MTKVSKNIRKLRTEHNMTQEDVARELFVTRQTISSWESGRTQPDIETIIKLSELFSVSAEELIYGRSKTMSASEKENASKQRLIIIFSVLGSVLTAVGSVLIFVSYWDKMHLAIKSVLSFIPMLAGQGAAVYTFIKRRSSVAWKESAAALWCAGVTATIALLGSIHQMNTDFSDCLFIDLLLTLPVMFILDAVTPLLFIHFGINYLLIDNLIRNHSFLLTNAVILALFAVASVYVMIGRKNKDDARHILAQWISLISFSVIAISDIILSDVNIPAILMMITTYFACVHFLFFGASYRLPYVPIGIIGTIVMSVIGVILYHPHMMYDSYGGYKSNEKATMIICAVLCVIIVTVTGILKRKKIKKNKIGIALFAASSLLILSEALCCIIAPEDNNIVIYFFTLISAFALALTVTAEGVMSNNFLLINAGLIAIAINLVFLLIIIIDANMLIAGIVLLLIGIALFTVNFLLAKKIKRTKEENSNA